MKKTLIAKGETTTNPGMYKELFKYYYKSKMFVPVTVISVIGILLILFGIFMFFRNAKVIIVLALFIAGVILAVYPRFAYRRPYKAVRNNKITTKYEFYDEYMIEIGENSKEKLEYSSFKDIHETKKYIYLFKSAESATVIDKSEIRRDKRDELFGIIRGAVPKRHF